MIRQGFKKKYIKGVLQLENKFLLRAYRVAHNEDKYFFYKRGRSLKLDAECWDWLT